ncbi:MAG: hypothetical protein BWY57_02137 [Betaproteobacteria bacterium ADurb.Bin341]|nr:MAG: hypothetical protein BWY57_02137 [Betaproteobacteria bacterium ADurb.Bin341]
MMAIGKAFDAVKDQKYPPTLPEFLEACREAARREGMAPNHKALPHHPTEEDRARSKKVIDEALRALKGLG